MQFPNPRVTEDNWFDNGTVEVRSRPLWVTVIENWFLWWDAVWHKLNLRVPTGNVTYWGDDAIDAAFHHFFTWTLNHGVEIDRTAKYADLKLSPREAEKERLWKEQLARDMDG